MMRPLLILSMSLDFTVKMDRWRWDRDKSELLIEEGMDVIKV